MSSDGWDPELYSRFAAERRRPFEDLLALVAPIPGGRAVDLGCGPGPLTRVLHERVGAASGRSASIRPPRCSKRPRRTRAAEWPSSAGTSPSFRRRNRSISFSRTPRSTGSPTTPPSSRSSPARWRPAASSPSRCRTTSITRRIVPPRRSRRASPTARRSRTPGIRATFSRPRRTPRSWIAWASPSRTSGSRFTARGSLRAPTSSPGSRARCSRSTGGGFRRRLFERFLDDYRDTLFANVPDERPFFFTYRRILAWARRPRTS